MALAEQVAGDDDEVVLQRLQAPGGPTETVEGRVRVVADLPVVSPARVGTPHWLVNRVALVSGRATKRNALIRRLKPDVTHLQLLNRFTDVWTMPAGPVVATVHDVLPHHHRLPSSLERALLARLYARLAAVVVHHPLVGRELQAQFGVPTQSIHCIPLVIAPNEAAQVRRQLSSPNILFFGSFRRNKGMEELCEAIRLLAPLEHLRFHFAGRGDASLEHVVRDLARSDPRVAADIGYAPSSLKDTLFRRASLVVLPYTTFSSQSAVLGDAYAAGTPVIVADVGALGGSVREDRTGWVLSSTRPRDIAEAIREALSDGEAWKQRAERCSAVAAERSPPVVARSYRALYASLQQR